MTEPQLQPQRFALKRPFMPNGGYAFYTRLPQRVATQTRLGAETYVTENGEPLPWPDAAHEEIRNKGAGMFSVLNDYVHFSSPDGSDCQKNGRLYEIVMVDWPAWHENVERDALSNTPRPLTRRLLNRYATHYRVSSKISLISQLRAFSMLHEESLLLLNYFASRLRGTILEIGPYMGASTIAMASALKAAGEGRLISVEAGGAHNHPEFPSTDIIKDLKANIARFKVEKFSHVVQGWAHDPKVIETVNQLRQGRPIDLLVIDADGQVEAHFNNYRPFLSDNCIIALDDYFVDCGARKDHGVRDWIAMAVDAGIVREFGVYRWGTWFGQLQPK